MREEEEKKRRRLSAKQLLKSCKKEERTLNTPQKFVNKKKTKTGKQRLPRSFQYLLAFCIPRKSSSFQIRFTPFPSCRFHFVPKLLECTCR